jgi:predicted transcriptional regulator
MRGRENRIHIINLLRNGPLNANQIATALQVNNRTVIHHIEVLCQAELIKRTQNSYNRKYSLTTEMENKIFYFDALTKQKPQSL